MRLLSLLAALCCALHAAQARPQRTATGPHHLHNAQLSGAAANSMAPLTSEWRDESVRRLSSGPEGLSDEVALSQSPYAWKPLMVSESRPARHRTSRYPPTPAGAASPSQTTPDTAHTTRRLLEVHDDEVSVEPPAPTARTASAASASDDGWVLLAVSAAKPVEKAAAVPAADLLASARELTAATERSVDEQVLASIRDISSTLLDMRPAGRVSVPALAAAPGPTDKTFQLDDVTLLEDAAVDGRRLSTRPQQQPPPQKQPQQSDEDEWLPVSLAVPSKPSKPGEATKSATPLKVSSNVFAQFLANHTLSPSTTPSSADEDAGPKAHYHYPSTFRPSAHYASASSPRPPATLPPPLPPPRPSRPPSRPPTTTPVPGKAPTHFTFSATISPSGSGHQQHFQEQPSQGVVSVIKRPVTMHHSSWGVGTPKPGHGHPAGTVINNYNDPAWYPKPPTAPSKPPHIIIIEDKVPEYQLSTPRPPSSSHRPALQVTSTGKPDVKCPNIVITASSLAQNHNGVAKEGLQGCSELNIVIQSSAANTNALPAANNDPIILGPAPTAPPAPPAPPKPTQVIITRPRPKPKPPVPPPAPPAQSDAVVPAVPVVPVAAVGAGAGSATAVAPAPSNNVGFWSNMFNGAATRFGVSFWSGVLLAPVIVLMAVGSLLTPWLLPYILSRRSDDNRRMATAATRYRGPHRTPYRTPHREAYREAYRADAAQRRALDARRASRCWATWRRRHRRTVPTDTVWWDDGVPPGWRGGPGLGLGHGRGPAGGGW